MRRRETGTGSHINRVTLVFTEETVGEARLEAGRPTKKQQSREEIMVPRTKVDVIDIDSF